MPQLPEVLSSVGFAPTAAPMMAPDALTRADDIFTAGMKDVSGNLAAMAGRMDAVRQQSQAASLEADAAIKYTDLKLKYANDPEPSTAPARFLAEAKSLQGSILDGIADPNTKSYVAKHLSVRIPTAYAEVAGNALHLQHTAAVGEVGEAVSTQAGLFGRAANNADIGLSIQGMRSAVAGAVAAGTIDQATGNKLFSAGLRQALTIRGTADPIGAQSLLDKLAPQMQAGDVAALTDHLHPRIERQQEDNAAGATIQMGGSTAARAMAVRDGFMKRGFDADTATAFAANAVQESGADPHSRPGDGGAAHGLFQWRDSRVAAFVAQYGHMPEQGTLDEQLDFAAAELKGSEAGAAGRIAEAQGANAKARAVSTHYLRPKDTANEEPRRGAIADRLSTYGAQPDLAGMLDDVRSRTAGLPLHVQQAAASKVIEQYRQGEAALAPARAELKRTLTDLNTGYEAGITDAEIPEGQIRTLMPPADADRMIENLRITKNAGTMFKQIAWATPGDIQDMRSRLAVPGSIASAAPRRDGKTVGAAPTDGSGQPESMDGMRQRLAVGAKLDELIAKRQHLIATDAAGYAASNPAVSAKIAAIDPSKPATVQDAAQSLLQLQDQLGVPAQQQRILTNTQVASLANQIATADPATTDMAKVGADLAKQYGPLWPRVMGELVTKGKVSPDFQLLQDMTSPAQAGPAADFQRMMQYREKRGGAEKMAQDANPDAVKQINKDLDATLDPFRRTLAWNSGGLDLINTMRDGIKQMATYYAIRGDDAGTALKKAYTALVDTKYETSGTMLIDKTQADPARVKAAAWQMQRDLKPADLQAPPARPGMPDETAEDRQAALLRAAQRGFWVPTQGTDGLMLMGTMRNGDAVPIRRADGSPVAIKFGALPAPYVMPDLPATTPDIPGNQPPADPNAPHSAVSLPAMPTGPHMGRITNRPVGAALGDLMHGRGG